MSKKYNEPQMLTFGNAMTFLEEMNEDHGRLENENNQLKNRGDSLERNLEDERDNCTRFSEENEALKKSMQDCEIARAKLQEQNRMLVNEKNRRRDVVSTLRTERDDLQRRLSKCEIAWANVVKGQDEARREAIRYRDMMRERAPNQIPAGVFPWESTAQPAPAPAPAPVVSVFCQCGCIKGKPCKYLTGEL